MTEFLEGLRTLSTEMEVIKKEYQQRGEKEIRRALSGFLNEFPEVSSIHWQQFTPYFNDGEPCVFNVHEICLSGGAADPDGVDTRNEYVMEGGRPKLDEKGFPLKNPDYDPDYDDFSWYEDDFVGEMSPKLSEARGELSRALESMEDILQHVFGDHARVRVTREGIDVEEYSDHD